MNISKVRAIIAILVVGIFMIITGVMAIYPMFAEVKVPMNDYADFFAKISSVYTGIIGVIVGYYFGRTKNLSIERKNEELKDNN